MRNLPLLLSTAAAGGALALTALGACGNSDTSGASGTTAGAGGSTGAGGAATSSSSSSGSTSSSGAGGAGGGAPPGCGDGAWSTYGHDAQRTGASDGCIPGALATQWRYDPVPPAGKKVNAVHNAVAQKDAAFLAWAADDGQYVGTSAADRVDTTGKRLWTFDSGTDSNLGNWPSIGGMGLVLQEDGIFFLDLATGMKTFQSGVDWWGQTIPDPARLYVVNTSHVDGPGIYVGAHDAMGKQLWQANSYGMCRIDAADMTGGLALDGGVLFYAPHYSPGQGVTLPFASGVYAFDGATGAPKWTQPATPAGAISAGSGHVYLVEGSELVARAQADGAVAWKATLTGASAQAPLLARGLVLIGTSTGVATFDAKTGAAGWTAAVQGAAVNLGTIGFSGGCVAGAIQSADIDTSMAAAVGGTGTLVVTAFDGVHVLSLADGKELWKGVPAMAKGTVKNPVVVGDMVYVVDPSGLLALKAM